MADAGSSGASTFLGLKKYIMETSRTRVKAFLHVANHGLASAGCTGVVKGGECDSLNQVNVEQALQCINAFPNDIIGRSFRYIWPLLPSPGIKQCLPICCPCINIKVCCDGSMGDIWAMFEICFTFGSTSFL